MFQEMVVGLVTVALAERRPEWTMAFLPNIKELAETLLFDIIYEAVLDVTVIVNLLTKKPEGANRMVKNVAS